MAILAFVLVDLLFERFTQRAIAVTGTNHLLQCGPYAAATLRVSRGGATTLGHGPYDVSSD